MLLFNLKALPATSHPKHIAFGRLQEYGDICYSNLYLIMDLRIVIAILGLIALPFVLYFLAYLLVHFFWFILGLTAIIAIARSKKERL